MNKVTCNIKNAFINIGVVLTVLIGIESILIGYNRQFKILSDISNFSGFINSHTLHMHRGVSVILGFGLIFISNRLYKRMRMAWVISTNIIFLLTIMHICRSGRILQPTVIVELFTLLILAVTYSEYKKESDPMSLKNGLKLCLVVIIIVLANILLTVYALKFKISNIDDVFNAALRTLKMLILMDPSTMGNLNKVEMIYMRSSIVINWVGIVSALIFLLKPLVYQPFVSGIDREKVRKLLREYSSNPVSYVSLGNDKKYYFGKAVEGVIAYINSAGVAVCAGDPICSDENLPLILAEFIDYCKLNDLELCICSALDKNIELYSQLGFSSMKCGEDAMFDLQIYDLKGKKGAKIRNAVNHAAALGIEVIEYKPVVHRDKHIEQQMKDISKQWLKNKKSSELSFMLGSPSLDNPMDRRYFAAMDKEGIMQGFIVFTPFEGGQGYYADVTRRRNNAPIGVMEKITVDAFDKMKSEGIKWGSLGLSPLANVSEDGKVTGKVLEFIYENFNQFYSFKSLHHYKKKFGCTAWEPRYLVFYQKIITPKIAYSIIKAQNPRGVSDFILSQLKALIDGKETDIRE